MLIQGFWDSLGGNKNLGLGFKRNIKMDLLKAYATIIVYYGDQVDREIRRKKFNKVKDRRHSFKSHRNCFVCQKGHDLIRHHIIQLQNGGINSKRNIVTLCKECHTEIHPHLKQS